MRKLQIFLPMIASVMLAACGSSSSKDDTPAPVADAAKLSTSFANNCASCHGATGGGGSGKNLHGYSKAATVYLSTVRSGTGSMPAFSAADYSDADANADVTYLKTL